MFLGVVDSYGKLAMRCEELEPGLGSTCTMCVVLG